jgi:D-aminoacyl-tRNA deacylase
MGLHPIRNDMDAVVSRRHHPSAAAMLALIQRVTEAKVVVDGQTIGAIGPGLLALVGVEPGDGPAQVAKLGDRLLHYRVFSDAAGKMNLSLTETGGGLLLVSQFTLAADTAAGLRPSFSTAAAPAEAEKIFAELVSYCRQKHTFAVETGSFGAHMSVSLVNDGPVTFLLRA